ncbi:hypothetical protein [Demequina iriomotensis]|uniref:hypothetical protein n=1 Tax=Demequina iriomotensis TaxID=1536641 RepID=UPI000780F633|nr:hypothetical protein [Demequina iriomotensis]
MIASTRDVLATFFVAGAAALAWAHATAADLPFTGSARATAALIFVFGLGACTTGSADSWEPERGRRRWYHRVGGALGLVAVAALVWALATGATAAVVALAAVVGVTWLMATVRHLVTPAAPAS